MRKCLFKSDKNIYKANLHCHTVVSDGVLTPEQIKEAYKSKGYSVVAFTDHDILKNHSYLNDDGFLAINSCEFEIEQKLPDKIYGRKKVYHFNLYSCDPKTTATPRLMQMDYDDINAINEYIREITREGFLVCYNHPYWSLQTHEDYGGLKGCFAMEIYNHSCETGDGYNGYSPQVYDEMLRQQNRIFCLATDDNHNNPGACPRNQSIGGPYHDSYGGFVMINSGSLEYASIMDSLKRGDFYSSQGPEIYEISLENNNLRIRCSDVYLIVVHTDGRSSYIKKGESLTEAEFALKGNEKYIRVTCRSNEKKDANSNAFWL